MLSAGVWRSWSRSSSGATKRRCRIFRSWNMQRRSLSISSNWEGKTRYFICLHWLHTLSNILFIKWYTKSIYRKCSTWVSGWMFLVLLSLFHPKAYGKRHFSQELKHEIKFRSCHFPAFYCPDILQIVEKPSELDIPQQIQSDETERTLIERIRSIKQEK